MTQQPDSFNLEHELLSHLDTAYNLARWLVRNDQEAEDMVQEAYLRAIRFSDALRGGDTRAWLLKIVRNTCYTLLKKRRPQELATFDEEIHNDVAGSLTPEALLIRSADRQLLHQALEELPVKFREVLVLRELEEMSYKEIAEIAEIRLGTVMSRLARAREQLRHSLLRPRDPGSQASQGGTGDGDASYGTKDASHTHEQSPSGILSSI
jgi:RNA polymerase sigma-70 factor (ECF subfamily)